MIVEPRHRRFLSEINIVPLVDVVLVLLVIFMVTAPMLHRALILHFRVRNRIPSFPWSAS